MNTATAIRSSLAAGITVPFGAVIGAFFASLCLFAGFLMGLFSGVAEFPVAILISVAAAAPIGLSVGLIAAPLVFALHKFGYCRLLTMSIAGAICGVLLAHITDVSWYLFVVAVFSGAFGGFAAWIGGQGPIRNDSHLDMALNQ